MSTGAAGSRHSLGKSTVSSSQSSEEGKAEVERNWRFTQWFKKMPVEDTLPDSDLLSAVEFDAKGDFLATGDKGGRVVVLHADPEAKPPGKIHYKFHCEFQSHEPEFDYVRSLAIDERINKIKFLPSAGDTVRMLTTNDRAIKLWRLQERDVKYQTGFNLTDDAGAARPAPRRARSLRLPRSEAVDSVVQATPGRLYSPEIHKFHIHSLAPSSDGETFLSADNLCVNLWHLDVPDVTFQLVNLKPLDMTKLTEYITAAELATDESHLFMYATNRGVVRLGDLRERALCDVPKREFVDPALLKLDKRSGTSGGGGSGMQVSNGFPNRPFLSDMLRNISDVKFAPGGRFIVARDFMTVKVWDMKMERAPVEVIPVHDYLNAKLYDLYEGEYLYDCFDVAVSPQGDILTGSYNNFFHVYDMGLRSDTMLEASKAPFPASPIVSLAEAEAARDGRGHALGGRQAQQRKKRASKSGLVSLLSRKKKSGRDVGAAAGGAEGEGGAGAAEQGNPSLDTDPDSINFDKRITQLAWHPSCNAVAVAGENNLFIYAR